jgi:hypothetical protein
MTHACVNANFVTTVTNMSNNKWGMFEAGAGNSVRLLDWDPNSGGSVRQHNQRAHCNTCETKKHLAPLLSHPLYTHHRNLHKICMHASIPSCANHGPLLHTYSTTKKLDMRVEAPTTANRVSNTTRCSTNIHKRPDHPNNNESADECKSHEDKAQNNKDALNHCMHEWRHTGKIMV